MLTTGFKLWFGVFAAAVGAAVFAGYTSGGDETGPLSLAWKGAVGNHVSYGLFVTAAAVALALAVFAVAVPPAVFVTGICIVAAVAVEWTMTNWSEKVSGDAAHNAAQREKLVRPVEIPVLGTLGVGVLVLAVSRVLLASSVDGAVLVATVVGVVIFGGAIFISRNPSLPRGLVQGVLLLGFLAVIVAGIVTAATGEREFHHKGGGAHQDDAHAEADH